MRARVPTFWKLSRSAQEPFSTIAEETEAVPFELAADGARAVIDPKDAWISSGFDHKVDVLRIEDIFHSRITGYTRIVGLDELLTAFPGALQLEPGM